MHQYASSTPEGRELVAELEFVWDQIKANSNSTSNESSPRGGIGVEDRSGLSYAGLGASRARQANDGSGGDNGPLRVLRPVSDADEYDGPDDDDGNSEAERYVDPLIDPSDVKKSRSFDIRNRKWRKRIEAAIFKMATELAALREQIEAKGTSRRSSRGIEACAWIRWLIWVAMRQLVVDAMLIGLGLLWAKRKKDQRLEQGLLTIMQAVKDRLRWIKDLRSWRLRSVQ
ncbi:MAG: hypothetical protein Q9174_005134 [Haloplaca sp. 1 TL-2023]